MYGNKLPTPAQLAALTYADARESGQIWAASRRAAEECCDRGWLTACHIVGMEVTDPNSVAYEITRTGREVLGGRAS